MTVLVVPGAFTRASSFERFAAAVDGHVVELPLRARRVPQLDLGGLRAADRAVDDAIRGRHGHGHGGPRPLVLVGHSLGGLLALRAARRHPVDALVLITPAPPDGLARDLAALLVRDPVTALKFAALALTTLPARTNRFGAPPRGLFTDGATPEVLADSVRHRVDESVLLLLQLVVGSRREIEPPDVPTLVVSGTHDGLIPAATVRRLAERLGADHVELPVAHAFSEEPAGEVVDETVRAWLVDRAGLPLRGA